MKQISFIHAADLHLDSPMVGLKYLPAGILSRVKESTFTALKRLTDEAILRKVDFVIFAGDLFDGEDRSLRAQSRFRTEMLRLAEHHIPVFVIHGNHDHLNGTWVHLDMPENVHIFSQEVEMKQLETQNGNRIHLYGFSYPERHVFDRKIDDYQKIEGADFHIGILHGNESGREEHGNYAPFSIKDLYEKNFDYWALGHIHKRAFLSENPPILYPGNLQGRNKKEKGPKGFYHVTLDGSERSFNFIETSDIVWEDAVIDASSAENFHQILELCQTTINGIRKKKTGTLLSLFLENVHLEDAKEKKSINSELLELLLEEEKEEREFVWIVELSVAENVQVNKEHLKAEANFYAEMFKTVEDYGAEEDTLATLYDHRLGRKYLSDLSNIDQKEIVEKAEKLLINLLYQS
ncbi:DNA repair exonuclease [Neobacillus niacini]|uniref:metallophosphoesterase family protein n=1 Tax=Neobacillus niacini TaxID=86668 RepID=UPI002857D05C|nr:DNA repair exonuclease [Neobacillus niacini]MDR7001300.1 DNA repair exonuclease SbcCD nuclease subunit [Neobacillus niacini]